jgi:serine/threonine-protein kinase HipA
MNADGDWRSAPSYDLTYAPGPGGEHYLDVEGGGKRPTRVHVETLGSRHGLSKKQIKTIVDDVRAAIADWRTFAVEAGVSPGSNRIIADAHARVARDF